MSMFMKAGRKNGKENYKEKAKRTKRTRQK